MNNVAVGTGTKTEQQTARTAPLSADLTKAAAIGVGTVAASSVVGVLWLLVVLLAGQAGAFGDGPSGDGWSAGAVFIAAAWIVGVHALAATGLALVALRRSAGLSLGDRVTACQLWCALSPVVWTLVSVVRLGLRDGAWSAALMFGVIGTIGSIMLWFFVLAPIFLHAIAKPLLRRDAATGVTPPSYRGSVYGLDEQAEDAEIGYTQ